ncbi:GntR family transcriptional regulator [Nonomuraea sp. MCN248]|uniref:GntR family transcriptional regulator n=1 Tax=Nonomuraea corallina TaxID=2989783 RepID=A0ABT4SIP3_9ACTN|nr:GntR family transcriptional regulator [Nonomuraea corallina]MDA0637072.1 GntR family transcriptional regulator [Nonomuraea corallina]
MIELDRSRPLWPQVAAIIRERIEKGEYAAGERIPPVLALVSEFGVTQVTVRKAIKALRDDHWIRTEIGMGSYVLTAEEREALSE